MGAITAVIAAAAVVQWRETRRTSQHQLRAYVFIEAARCLLGSERVAIKIKFKNFGATPAFDVVVRFAVAPSSALPAIESIAPKQKCAFAPTASMTISDSRPLDDFLIKAEGKVDVVDPIHVLGRIDYRDSFGHPRWTNFKLRYSVSAHTTDEGLSPTEDGNDAN